MYSSFFSVFSDDLMFSFWRKNNSLKEDQVLVFSDSGFLKSPAFNVSTRLTNLKNTI